MKLLCKVVLIPAQAENPDSVRKLIALGSFALYSGFYLNCWSVSSIIFSPDVLTRGVKEKELFHSDAPSLLDGNKLSWLGVSVPLSLEPAIPWKAPIPEAILLQVTGRELESSPVAGIAVTQVSLWDLCVSFWCIEMFGAYPSTKEISFICLFFHSFISSGNIYYESSNARRCSGCWDYKSGAVFVPAFPALKI